MRPLLCRAFLLLIAFGYAMPCSADSGLETVLTKLPKQSKTSPPLESKDAQEHARLLQIINRQTDVATREKMNVDYLPGMVTVYTGEELAAQGMYTVADAFTLINGLRNRVTDYNGNPLTGGTAFRWMLNHGVIDTLSDKSVWSITHIPISQVSRIEIVHGPGANVRGHSPYAGLIHIVTRTSGTYLQGSTSSDLLASGSGHTSWKNASGSTTMNLGLAGWRNGSADRNSGIPIFRMQMAKASKIDKIDSDPEIYRYLFFSMNYKDSTRLNFNHMGFEDEVSLSAPSSSGTVQEILGGKQSKTNLALDFAQHWNSKLKSDFHLGFQHHQNEINLLNPKLVAGYTTLSADDVVRKYDGYENVTDMGVSLTMDHWQKHKLRADLQGTHNYIEWDDYGAGGAVTPSKQDRFNWNAVLEDMWSLNSTTSLTTSMRYDYFDLDIGGKISPRVAMVKRVNEKLTLKTQYVHAIRVISRNEAQDGYQQPESSDTVELGGIYRTKNQKTRITAFHSWRRNIHGAPSGVDDSVELTGLEIGGEYILSPKLKLDGWADIAAPKGDGINYDGKVNRHVHIGANYRVFPKWNLNMRIDYRVESSSHLTAGHITLLKQDFIKPGMLLRLNLHNLFHHIEEYDTYDPAFISRLEISQSF
ncbi:MAG: TonB-dependent receptor [Magnetococcales bacterium]|nr:TonB-dependent receptor [Magnetococcales bacterium]